MTTVEEVTQAPEHGIQKLGAERQKQRDNVPDGLSMEQTNGK